MISAIVNLLKILENDLIDFKHESQEKQHLDFSELDASKQFLFLINFSMKFFCSLVFAVVLITNLEFFMNKFWVGRLEMAGLSASTSLTSL